MNVILKANSSNLEGLNAWLQYIESLHELEIEFGLQRVETVFRCLFPQGLKSKVIIVGGTNGKGTTCSYVENILLAAGYSCGKNTSPHISQFNERITVNGELSNDEDIVCAFSLVENARKDTLLTYFEFTFLAALVIFENKKLNYSICEVGMGGRLDAVNILSPIASIITTIGLDHVEWLGDSREKIAMEKVAISRPSKICVVGEVDFPVDAEKYLEQHNVLKYLNQKDFFYNINEDGFWSIRCESLLGGGYQQLPRLIAPHLYQNASCAILALALMKDMDINIDHIKTGLMSSFVQGRCQVLNQEPLVIVDVAHNVDSVKALANFLESQPVTGRTVGVCSMLSDKDIKSSLDEINYKIDEWFIAPLDSPRAATVDDIRAAIQSSNAGVSINKLDSIQNAYLSAKNSITKNDCVVVFGSFFVVGDILRHH
jgi:dihydrofolate synthase/folylpolyglutamate synthase